MIDKYKIRYPLGKLKKRTIEYFRKKNISKTYARLPNRSYERLMDIKNIHNGKDCFIVGNGPSLKQLDLTRLYGKHCIFFNGAFDLRENTSPECRIHLCEDRLVFEDHQEKLNSLDGLLIYPSDLRHFINSKNPIILEFHRAYSEKNKDWPQSVDINKKFPIFYWGGTVAYLGLQVAQWMGFENIYIIGVDLSYSIPDSVIKDGAVLTSTDDDPNHYKSSYFGKGLRWHLPEPERMLRAFKHFAEHHDHKKNIYNAGYGGNLNCFERVDFEYVSGK
mgnify:CR=1 FL=1